MRRWQGTSCSARQGRACLIVTTTPHAVPLHMTPWCVCVLWLRLCGIVLRLFVWLMMVVRLLCARVIDKCL